MVRLLNPRLGPPPLVRSVPRVVAFEKPQRPRLNVPVSVRLLVKSGHRVRSRVVPMMQRGGCRLSVAA
jgi:hypothetical protein